MRHSRLLVLLALAVALSSAFGVADRVVQGHSSAGWYLANVAGVWLAVAFAFGALTESGRESSAAGLLAEMSALAGYYGWMYYGQHQSQPLEHPVFWSCCGLLAGPLFGLIGYHWRRRRSQIAGATLGIVFVLEAVVLGLAGQRPATVVAVEALVGIALVAVLLEAARWRGKRRPFA